jgi:Xaa-Pro dipeptidase
MAEWRLPQLSLEERDRRWAKVRQLMRAQGVDCLIATGSTGQHYRNHADAKYLTQLGQANEEVGLFFPVEGKVVAMTNPPGPWPSDSWTGPTAPARGGWVAALIELIRQAGLEQATVGVIGLAGGLYSTVRQADGFIPYTALSRLKAAFPRARFVNAAPILGEARYVKSDEEVQFLRKAVWVAEQSMQAMVETAGSGVFEPEVMAAMYQASIAAGGSLPIMLGWYSGPFGRAYHRLEQPAHRRLESGDYLMVETEGRWGGYVGQLDQSLTIGAVPAWAEDAFKVAVECFFSVLAAMKPGVAMGELRQAARSISRIPEASGDLIMHGRGLGDDGPLVLPSDPPDSPIDAVQLQENTVFLLKPPITYKGQRDVGHVGDTVVVTARGAERLGTRPLERYLHVD